MAGPYLVVGGTPATTLSTGTGYGRAMGWIADTYGFQTSFLLTAACELYILFHALWGSKVTNPLPANA